LITIEVITGSVKLTIAGEPDCTMPDQDLSLLAQGGIPTWPVT
jgi:hypothetical protein